MKTLNPTDIIEHLPTNWYIPFFKHFDQQKMVRSVKRDKNIGKTRLAMAV